MSTLEQYRNGGEGFILWAEENARVPIYPEGSVIPDWYSLGKLPDTLHPETGKSYRTMWEAQQEIVREALRMENGRFVYRLIVFCWPRGEGKSLLLCLIEIWRFSCWPREKIMLGANSKDQVKFVHYDIICDIIKNSPKLLRRIGRKKVKIKDITLRNRVGDIISIIQCVSSFSGIFSNITSFSFSEMFDMKNTKFYTQIYGSIRNIPNAFGAIDSTVSSKTHVLYRLYKTAQKRIQKKGTSAPLFFSYRCSKEGDIADYWNPYMTKEQLDSYREEFPLGDFERYFLNLWSAGAENTFTQEMVEATNYLGADNLLLNHGTVIELVKKRTQIIDSEKKFKPEFRDKLWSQQDTLDVIENRLWSVEREYKLRTPQNEIVPATGEDLSRLTDLFDTDWAVLVGCDRADPMKKRTAARTIITVGAKGLPGSRSTMPIVADDSIPHYLYLLLHLAHIQDSSIEGIKEVLLQANHEYDDIDMFCSERWGVWDMEVWLKEQDIAYEIFYPTYDRQKTAFVELYLLYETGRFKAPPTAVPGSKGADILAEEPTAFQHNPLPDPTGPRGFYSVEKNQKYGIQDDVMYALGCLVYGGRMLGVNDFRSRSNKAFFGEIFQQKGLVGVY